MNCTSQWSKIAERPAATDLRGGKTSEDSFTILMASFVVEYAVDFQPDPLSPAAPGSLGLFEICGRLLSFLLKTDRIRLEMVRSPEFGGKNGQMSHWK